MAHVVLAQPEDIPAWLALATEVEPLFGPMVSEPSFHRALHKHIGRGTAFCVRDEDGRPGDPLLGGLLFSLDPPIYRIGWLAVAELHRRQGIGILVDTICVTPVSSSFGLVNLHVRLKLKTMAVFHPKIELIVDLEVESDNQGMAKSLLVVIELNSFLSIDEPEKGGHRLSGRIEELKGGVIKTPF